MKDIDEVVRADTGEIVGVLYAIGSGWEAWKRERLKNSETPIAGNRHRYAGSFSDRDSAIAAIKGESAKWELPSGTEKCHDCGGSGWDKGKDDQCALCVGEGFIYK